MSNLVAAIVPGILGSRLWYERTSEPLELWGENLFQNYSQLCKQPHRLDWTGEPARPEMLKEVRPFQCLSFGKRTIYKRLLGHAQSLPNVLAVIESPYDWRDSVFNSCATVARQISVGIGSDVSQAPGQDGSTVLVIAHSLGGLVVKAAIATGLIHPRRIDRLVLIGCPQQGSPAAFRSMYSDFDLPLFDEVAFFFRAVRKIDFRDHLLRSYQTFPSLHQLLPEKDIHYLCYSPVSRNNPLKEAFMSAAKRQDALDAQAAFAKADRILQVESVPSFAIYTSAASEFTTDHEYLVRALAIPSGYEIAGVYYADKNGDGTVPAYSAKGDTFYAKLPIVNCRHALMCEADAALEALTRTAPGVRAEKV